MPSRRHFLAGALASSSLLTPFRAFAQRPLVGADMHSHWGMAAYGGNGELNSGDGLRQQMVAAGILLVAMKVIADFPTLLLRGGGVVSDDRGLAAGSLRNYFTRLAGGVLDRARRDGLGVVGTAEDLKAAIANGKPAIALTAEGADFLEGKLEPLAEARALGLCHLQLMHYRVSEVGDIATQAPKYNGLSGFGKELVAACNKQGILVDIAHCNSAGIEQALEISTKPIVYSHGFVAQQEVPDYKKWNARAIHLPLAKTLAAKGGVVGIWPLGWRNPEAFAEYLNRIAGVLGPSHIGIGTDHSGIPSSALSGYGDYPKVAEALTKAGLKSEEVNGIMGGNYLRVLQQAMTV